MSNDIDPRYWKDRRRALSGLGGDLIDHRPDADLPRDQQTIGAHSNAEMGLIASFYFFAYTGMQIPAGIR